MANNKDIDDLYLEALGYYASLSVMSVLASYVLYMVFASNPSIPWFLKTILLILVLALMAFFAGIQEAFTNKIWIPMMLLGKENPKTLSARYGHDVLVILYYAILMLPPIYTLSNIF